MKKNNFGHSDKRKKINATPKVTRREKDRNDRERARLHLDFLPEIRAAIKETARSAGVPVNALVAHCVLGTPLPEAERVVSDEDAEAIKSLVRQVQALGITVRDVLEKQPSDGEVKQAMVAIQGAMRAIIEKVKDR